MDKLEKFVDTMFFPIAGLTIIVIFICVMIISIAFLFVMLAMLISVIDLFNKEK